MTISLRHLAIIHTPYKQKFGIPRQPGLVSAAKGVITFCDEFNDPNMLCGIEQFSHIWLIFQFHQTLNQGWKPTVRPPRLGGNKKLGVLATRSSFRPNGLGMSVVKLESVNANDNAFELIVSGMDLLDGTPILDIKPYIPYSDSLDDAQAGYASDQPSSEMSVEFSATAKLQLASYQQAQPELANLIEQVLKQDPRPAYQKSKEQQRVYGMSLYDYNIKWHVENNISHVLEIHINPL